MGNLRLAKIISEISHCIIWIPDQLSLCLRAMELLAGYI
jgi:hypothetical protein